MRTKEGMVSGIIYICMCKYMCVCIYIYIYIYVYGLEIGNWEGGCMGMVNLDLGSSLLNFGERMRRGSA